MTLIESPSTEGEEVQVVENVSAGEVVEYEQIDAVQSSSATEPPTLECQPQIPSEILETLPSIHQQKEVTVVVEEDEDDEFGDFGDVSTSNLPLPPPVAVVQLPPALPELHPIHVPESLHELQAFIDSFTTPELSSFMEKDGKCLVLDHLFAWTEDTNASWMSNATSNSVPPLLSLHESYGAEYSGNLWRLNVHSESISGAADYFSRLFQETVYTERAPVFRWRKSKIRKSFVDSLEVLRMKNLDLAKASKLQIKNIVMKDGTPSAGTSALNSTGSLVATPSSANVSNTSHTAIASSRTPISPSTEDARRLQDLQEAKKLCDMTQEEMAALPPDQLLSLITHLREYQAKMLEQANYWLDAKEQLVMDGEMHQRMIGSLVNYAKQQHGLLNSNYGKKMMKK